MRITSCLLVVFAVGLVGPVHAQDPPGDKFKITLGGYSVFRFDSKVALSNPKIGAGAFIDPQDTLGLDSEQTVARLSGYYRFNPRHGLDFAYYRISSDGGKILEEEFEWVDEDGNDITIPVGATVKSALDYEILKLGYLWSFYHSDKVELAAGAGLHVARINFDLAASTTNSGEEAGDGRVTVPLPVLSFKLNYAITSRLSWLFKTELFGLRYSDVTGIYSDSTLAMEYRFVENFGIGFGLGSSTLDVQEDTGNKRLDYENTISGLLLYGFYAF